MTDAATPTAPVEPRTPAPWASPGASLNAIADRLRGARSVVLLTHAKPDGDALGSTLGIARALDIAAGASGVLRPAECWYVQPVPSWHRNLAGDTKIKLLEPTDAPPHTEPDAILVTDTGSWNQVEPLGAWLRARKDRVSVLDHHLRGDDDMADLRYADTSCAAVCEPAAQLSALLLGADSPARLPSDVATSLYTGLATDTGWFRHSNVTPNTLRLAADLVEAGADHVGLFAMLYQQDRPGRLKLMAAALDGLELDEELGLATMVLTRDDFDATGAAPGDSGGFVDIPQSVPAVRVVALLTEQTDPEGNTITKISLRSKDGEWNDHPPIDVNAVAGTLGGGHARAAGARVIGKPADVREKLIEAIRGATS